MDQQNAAREEEITLKELIINTRDFLLEVLKSWKLLFLFVVPLVAIMLYMAYTKPTVYLAKLTFTVNELESKNMGGVGSILNQFGFGGGGGEYNRDKIVELSLSFRIVQAALFEKGTVNGQEDYLANHIIRAKDLHEKWKKDTTGLKDFVFADNKTATFSRTENTALKKLYGIVKGNAKRGIEGLIKVSYGEMSGIFSLLCESTTEELSIQFVQALYSQLSSYYIEGTTEKPRLTYINLSEKTDSIGQKLEATEYALAKFMDTNRLLSSKTAELKRRRLERQVKILTIAYGKVIENLEVAEFSLKNSTPFFQLIDLPFAPIPPKRESRIKAILIGGFLGGFLGVCFILGRKIVREALVEE